MADGREQRGPQLVALHQGLGVGRLRLQPPGLEGDGELGGEGAEHLAVGAQQVGAGDAELDARR